MPEINAVSLRIVVTILLISQIAYAGFELNATVPGTDERTTTAMPQQSVVGPSSAMSSAASIRQSTEIAVTAASMKATTTSFVRACENPMKYAQAGWPDWFTEAYFLPAFENEFCVMPVVRPVNFSYVLLDPRTGVPAERFAKCRLMPKKYGYDFLFAFFNAFYGFPHPTSTLARPFRIFNMLIFACYPLALAAIIFGAIVTKQFLIENQSSNIYIYHFCILAIDQFLYLFCALQGSGLAAFIVWPFCFMGSVYLEVNPQGVAESCFDYSIDMVYCLGSCVQAALAVDRAIALRYPIWYHMKVTRGYIRISVWVVLTANLALFCIELCSVSYFLAAILNTSAANPMFLAVYFPFVTARISLRTALFTLSLVVQIIAYAIILKSASSRVADAIHRETVRRQRNSCRLLFGTALLNFCGGTVQWASLAARLCSDASCAITAVETKLVQSIVSPFLSVSVVYVHLLSSSHYRQIAGRSTIGKPVAVLWRQIKRVTAKVQAGGETSCHSADSPSSNN